MLNKGITDFGCSPSISGDRDRCLLWDAMGLLICLATFSIVIGEREEESDEEVERSIRERGRRREAYQLC